MLKPFAEDPRFSDSGRRTITLGGKSVGAALASLRREDAQKYQATHEIVAARVATVRPGMIINFDGVDYRVVVVTDPRADDPDMRGRYVRMIVCKA